MNRPLGVLIGIGLIVIIALGAIASKVGETPPDTEAATLNTTRPTDVVRQSGRSAFAPAPRAAPSFPQASTVPVRSASIPPKPMPTTSSTESSPADSETDSITGAPRRRPIPQERPTPLGANRTVGANNSASSIIANRNARREAAARNATAARQSASERLQQVEASGIGRSIPLAAEARARVEVAEAPIQESLEPQIGMSAEMQARLLAQLEAGVGRNPSSTGSTTGSTGAGSGATGSTSSGGSTSGPTTSTGSGGGASSGGSSGSDPGSGPPAGGITGPNAVDTTGAVSASFRWVPVATPADCSNSSTARIADLYVRVNTGAPVAAVESGGASQLRITGGPFIQSSTGTNLPPTSTDPCAAIDSFLDLGGQSATVLPTGSTPVFGTGTSAAITAGWVSLSGVTPTPAATRFGDNQFYLRVARIAAPKGASVSGALTVGFLSTVATPSVTLTVQVPNCVECWDSTAAPPPTTGGGTDPPPTGGGTDPPPTDGGTGTDNGTGGGSTPGGGTGGGSTPGGGTGGDGSTGGNGGTDPDPDPDPDDEEDEVFNLVWLPITNTCTDTSLDAGDLGGFKTYDLFIRMSKPHQILTLDSTSSSTAITLSGQIFQHPDYGTNMPPLLSRIKTNPCLAFDSYFDANGSLAGFFFEPDFTAWPSPMRTLWFPTLGVVSRGTTNAGFGGALYYYRIMRITIGTGGSVGGTIGIGGRHFDGTQNINIELAIPALP